MRNLSEVTVKAFVNSVLRTLLKIGKRPKLAKAGFALPTTMMVILVVTLLTTTMVLRSLDRNRNAIFTRSEQVIQNSSTPAIDRANAKLAELLTDPDLPRGTPPDEKLLEVMSDAKYTFGDETRLKVAYDTNSNGIESRTSNPNIDPKLDETINSAWMYPVDTDGNGLFDSFTLYGLYWRNPPRSTPAPGQPSKYNRERLPLEARSVPQDTVGIGSQCKSAGLAAAVAIEGSDWFKQGENQSKAFYAYAATVPITTAVDSNSAAPFTTDKFEINPKANKAFSGLEYQQDRYRSGLNNTAVWTENDLILNPGDPFRLNGKVFTNSNMLVGSGALIQLFQVSDPFSCFYDKENAKITVGGNVIFGDLTDTDPGVSVTIDLFDGKESSPRSATIDISNQSTRDRGSKVAYNDAAYTKRINLMKQTALSFCTGCSSSTPPTLAMVNGISQYPDDLKKSFEKSLRADNSDPYATLEKDIEIYLRNLTRRVPFAEVPSPDGDGSIAGYTPDAAGVDASVFSGGFLDPPDEWRLPTDANTRVTLDPNKLDQNNPENLKKTNDPEKDLGDRVNVGNNLPALWQKDNPGEYSAPQQGQPVGVSWKDGGARTRQTQVEALEDVGRAGRNGYWELAAAADPSAPNTSYAGGGGLRVITGAGIYVDGSRGDPGVTYPRDGLIQPRSSFLPRPSWDSRFVDPEGSDTSGDPRLDPKGTGSNSENDIPKFNNQDNIVVWPDLMPMSSKRLPQPNRRKSDLLMRASVVYHYVDFSLKPGDRAGKQEPIGCVSSYYDPTDKNTARNPQGLPDVSGVVDTDGDGTIDQLYDGTPAGPQPAASAGRSNNGVSYTFPGRGKYQLKLRQQARLVFPNGRVVNQPLRDALSKPLGQRTLADYSAIDAAICAIGILEGEATIDDSKIPHGAIKESSFLDAREVKAIDKLIPNDPNYDLNKNYDLELEERQPLEVRVTDIDLGVLAKTSNGTSDSNADGALEVEYLLPNSGIIYASRDDALPDLSGTSAESATDFKLDPTRRPNGIRLINGLRLARGTGNDYNNKTEKGLILATNTPTYVKGHLNLHLASGTTIFNPGDELEEFTEALEADWRNFYTRGTSTLDRQFACRENQPLCVAPGDQWRPATIIADAITLQSTEYAEGYRNQGDFDLSNILGNASFTDPTDGFQKTVAGTQVGNGFFNNSFLTSTPWFDTGNNFPVKNTSQNSQVSYAVNGVTPVQRRARAMTYLTEMCTKIPVSSCTSADWIIPAVPAQQLDTSEIAQVDARRRFVRRVAFEREPGTSKYNYDSEGYPILKQQPQPTDVKDNALWFQTRDDATGAPSFTGGTTATTRQPYIFHPPEVPDLGLLRGYGAAGSSRFAPLDIANPITRQTLSGSPPADVTSRIQDVYNSIVTPSDPTTPLAQAVAKTTPIATGLQTLDINLLTPDKRTEITGGGMMGVYKASSLFLGQNNPLTLKGDPGSVFVFIIDGNLTVNTANALKLEGVVQDNVYWIVGGQVLVRQGSTFEGNVLALGNIALARSATINGRVFSGGLIGLAGNATNGNLAQIVAPEGNQPRLVPVTQIQSPSGIPAATLQIGNQNDYRNIWLQQPRSTNYNAAFVVGNSPDRPGESSAGLQNLVRVQENWSPEGSTAPQPKQSATIKGSFIQTQRSSYATGPFGPIRRTGLAPTIATTNELSIFGYADNKYQTNVGAGTQPYYSPPIRQWGFDVGLLSQTPDLFSQRFTQNISKTQNYYRQVGRDDLWVKALLCAAAPSDPSNADERVGESGTTYTRYAVPDNERPNCPSVVGASIPYPANP
jgi:hypothetical protein